LPKKILLGDVAATPALTAMRVM